MVFSDTGHTSEEKKENQANTLTSEYLNMRAQQLDLLQRVSGVNRPTDEVVPSNKAEYFTALRKWLWEYQCWNSFNAGFPFFLMNQMYGNQLGNISQVHNTSYNQQLVVPPNNVPQRTERRGAEYYIPPIWKRFVAEFIDFLLLIIIKLIGTFFAADYLNLIDVEKYNFDFNLEHMDYRVAFEMTSEIVIVEIIHRSFVCLYEALCLTRGFNSVTGTTPGKAVMGLRCVYCEFVTEVPGSTRVFVYPASDVGFFWALLRSVMKNFSLAIFFPITLTVFFFSHNRTAYDVFSNTIIVEHPEVRQVQ